MCVILIKKNVGLMFLAIIFTKLCLHKPHNLAYNLCYQYLQTLTLSILSTTQLLKGINCKMTHPPPPPQWMILTQWYTKLSSTSIGIFAAVCSLLGCLMSVRLFGEQEHLSKIKKFTPLHLLPGDNWLVKPISQLRFMNL